MLLCDHCQSLPVIWKWFFILMPLSSAEVSLCCWGAGEKKKKTARGEQWEGGREKRGLFPPFPSSDRAPRTIYFFYYCYFYRDTQPEPLRRRELKRWQSSLMLCVVKGFLDQATSSCHFRVGSREPTFLAANQWRSFGVSLISVGDWWRKVGTL